MFINVWTWNKTHDKSLLHFDVKKKYIDRLSLKGQSQFDCKYWILDIASWNS